MLRFPRPQGLIVLVAILLHIAFASARPPHQGIVRPLEIPANYSDISRRASQDPSCPDGFLCTQQPCGKGIVCPDDRKCVNFEGTIGCAVPGLSWCALNPTTFEAVGCDGGICCHGNCYVSDAVCCNNANVKCTIGGVCNVCSRGQTCGTDGCLGGPGETSTTTTKAISSASPTTVPMPPVTPTVVPRVDSFVNKGCFQDPDLNNRVLKADDTADDSSTGMTVKRCVAFARANNWQYAGVEFGSECFVGNTLRNAQVASQSDCSKVCAGDSSALCGNGNRIQVYQDETWYLPTVQELVDDLNAYTDTLKEARSAIAQYHSHLQSFQAHSKSNSKTRRQDGPVLSIELRIDIENIQDIFPMLKKIQATLIPVSERTRKGFNRATGLDIVIPGGPPVNEETANELEMAVETSTELVQDVLNAAGADNALIEPALAANVVPALEVATHLTVVSTAATTIGTVAIGTTPARGIFAALAAVLLALRPRSGGDNPTKGPTATVTTTTSTTSSSTCTMTATQTPIIIVTRSSTSKSEFDDLVRSLPKNQNNIQKTDSWLPNWIYIATLDQCTSESLWKNPIVLSMSIDAQITVDDLEAEFDFSTTDTSQQVSRARFNTTDDLSHADAALRPRSTPGPTSRFKQQTPNSPGHLNWLTQLSRLNQLRGSFLDFEEYIFDDGPAQTGNPSTVYVIDSTFLNGHTTAKKNPKDIASRVIDHWAPNQDGSGTVPQLFYGTSHGVCMTSLAAGSYSGVAKRAKIVTIQLPNVGGGTRKEGVSRAVFALLTILRHVQANNGEGRSVVTMSFGILRESLWWEGTNDADIPPDRFTDAFEVYLPVLMRAGIVPLCSAGNLGALRDLSLDTPRSAGGRDTGLIVVGNAQYDGTRHPTSQFLDRQGKGILSLYNAGTDIDCAATQGGSGREEDDPGMNWRTVTGTSPATAITAGMVAYLLAHPVLGDQLRAGGLDKVAMNVKTYLQATGRVAKGDAGTGDGIPRAATGERVPCQGGQVGRPATPPVFIPGPFNGRSLLTRDITNGQTVLVNADCWALQ